MNNASLQEEEIETLQSIYFPHEFKATKRRDGWKAVGKVSVDLPANFTVHGLEKRKTDLVVSHLPPIHLKLVFGEDYPTSRPPRFFLICKWLSPRNVKKLGRLLEHVWKKNFGFAIVHTWMEYLKTKTLSDLNITNHLDVTEVSKRQMRATAGNEPRRPRNSLIADLENYNNMKTLDEFLKGFHECIICLTEHLGSDSMLFEPCQHIVCRSCLRTYFTTVINDGNCTSVKCPGLKCETGLSQKQIRELLPPDLFEKYDRLLLNVWLDSTENIIYCPRVLCQYPTTREGDDTMAECPACLHAFCVHCRMTYHGVESCKINSEERKKLVEGYQSAAPDERLKLEARYGKRQIENLVHNTLSEFWIEGNSQKCPKCKVGIEKSDGCNKMTCFRCGSYFCWLCSRLLDRFSPYAHFQDPKSPCNNKLFEFEPDEGEDDWEIEELNLEDSGSEDIETDDPDSDNGYAF